MLVFIDPGHGGKDPGAVDPEDHKGGDFLKTQEKDVNLKLGKMVQSFYLHGVGVPHDIEIRLTRTSDVFVGLAERAEAANKAKADLFISLHCNAASDPDAKGLEVYHYPKSLQGERLAQLLYNEMQMFLTMNERGVREANFAVLRQTKCPAALIELGFLTNKEDEKLVSSNSFLLRAATGIWFAIVRYRFHFFEGRGK